MQHFCLIYQIFISFSQTSFTELTICRNYEKCLMFLIIMTYYILIIP